MSPFAAASSRIKRGKSQQGSRDESDLMLQEGMLKGANRRHEPRCFVPNIFFIRARLVRMSSALRHESSSPRRLQRPQGRVSSQPAWRRRQLLQADLHSWNRWGLIIYRDINLEMSRSSGMAPCPLRWVTGEARREKGVGDAPSSGNEVALH